MSLIHEGAERRQAVVAELIDRLVAEVEPLHRQYNESLWLASVTGRAENVAESARLDAQIRKLFARREPYELLRDASAAGGVADPLLQRQLTLLLNDFRAHQIAPEMIERMVQLEKGLDSRFNNFRAELDHERVSDNRLREILHVSDDSDERRRAWEASKQIGGQVVEDLLELVRLRNQAAKQLGFDHYYSMMLTLDELDEHELFGLLDDLDRGTRPLFKTYKRELDARLSRRFGIGTDDLRPWHYSDPYFQEAPAADLDLDPYYAGRSLAELTERFYTTIGFEIRDLLERADLEEKPGKSQHAFCLSVDRGADIRVLCNVRPNEYWMSTMLHEFGHAVYDKYVDRTLPFALRMPAHTMTTEASAMLFGRLSKNAAWLHRYAGLEPEAAREAGAKTARAIRSQLLVQTRWCLVMAHMERELYRDPSQELSPLWWDLVEKFQWLRRPGSRLEPDWASKIHFSVAPVYYHNYMLGEIMASQLQEHLRHAVLGEHDGSWEAYVASPTVGAYLKDRLYGLGKSVDWREAIRRATGQPLNPSAFIAELAGTEEPS